jgi:hypothetical protein
MLFSLFFILGLMHIPVLNSFVAGGFYDSQNGIIVGVASTSIGNLGFSQTQCL